MQSAMMPGGADLPKCLIIYYSDSGTTAKIAKQIAEGLVDRGWEIEQYNLNGEQIPGVENYQLIGIGSPVYFFHTVGPIKKYVNGLPKLHGLPVFTFAAFGTNPGNAIIELNRLLENKDASMVGSLMCRNANFILGFRKAGDPLDLIRPEELDQALVFGSMIGRQTIARLQDCGSLG
jgi:flavodoxin